MIEVSATLKRGGIYLAGENVQSLVTFHHLGRSGEAGKQSQANQQQKQRPKSNSVETISWCSVQLQCLCHVNESKVSLPRPSASKAQSSTGHPNSTQAPNTVSTSAASGNAPVLVNSGIPPGPSTVLPASPAASSAQPPLDVLSTAGKGEPGVPVFTTPPRILYCNLRLMPGETKSFPFEELLPNDSPPTYKGSAIRYTYRVILAIQRLNSSTRILRLPFRVLVMHGLSQRSLESDSASEETPAANPFLAIPRAVKDTTLSELAQQHLSASTGRRQQHCYNITNARGKVARFCLYKDAYKLGEEIIGLFDFSTATAHCVEVSVSLQSEEVISADCAKKPGLSTSHLETYSTYQEFCAHLRQTHISLPIPLSLTPGFLTNLVTVNYRLHFEFITSSDGASGSASGASSIAGHVGRRSSQSSTESNSSQAAIWRAPVELNTETLSWDLPIRILPSLPLHTINHTPLTRTTVTVKF